MKSDLQIAPVYHRLPERIRAHAVICFLALLLHRIVRSRLTKNGSVQNSTDAVRILNCVKRITVNINGESYTGLTRITEEQLSLFDRLEVAQPNALEIQVK